MLDFKLADQLAKLIKAIKADIKVGQTHAANTGNPHNVTKAQAGLGNADNTADAAKPVSTAQQVALDLKAPAASPVFTGPVSLGVFTVAGLPAAPPAGALAYASNGRKTGEGVGAGTGLPVYYSAAAWRVFGADAVVTA